MPEGMTYSPTSWVCDDYKEAIAFIKDFKKEYNKAQEMLNEVTK